jgi:protein PsiE
MAVRSFMLQMILDFFGFHRPRRAVERRRGRAREESGMLVDKAREVMDRLGQRLVDGFLVAALFVIGATVVWAAVHEYLRMIGAGSATLDDILLLFIYLELGAMVGVYFKTDRLPVLYLLYVAITALTRFLVVDMKELAIESVLLVAGAILILTVAVLILQVAASRFEAAAQPR